MYIIKKYLLCVLNLLLYQKCKKKEKEKKKKKDSLLNWLYTCSRSLTPN